MNSVFGQSMRLGFSTEEPAQKHGKGTLCQERNVLLSHFEGEDITCGNGRTFAALQRSESIRISFEHAK